MEYSYIDDPNALAHYGVLGMKWGVRKDKYAGKGDWAWRSDMRRVDKINAAGQKRLAKAQSKLNRAKQKGASLHKINKLEKRVQEHTIRNEVVAKRNRRVANRGLEYRRNTTGGQRFIDSITGAESRRVAAIGEDELNKARKKYGEFNVKRVETKDTAKLVGAMVAVGAAEGIYYATMMQLAKRY